MPPSPAAFCVVIITREEKPRLHKHHKLEIKMTAYVILDINVHDAEGYEEYKKLSPAAVAAYGGKFVVRGGKAETLEGSWSPTRLVVLEFESSEIAKKWINSEEYRVARSMRHKTATSQAVVVEGV